MELVQSIIDGNIEAAARLMSGIENEDPEAFKQFASLYPHVRGAHTILIMGPGGVGKSTIVNSLVNLFVKECLAIGVIAVDPSSALTGGALLGDRVRMSCHNLWNNVFFRSLASREQRGGLARAAIAFKYIMDASGKDLIFLESTGIGQNDGHIAKIANTSVLVLMPGVGDEIQMMKSGTLEMADIIVINKADIFGAEEMKWQIEQRNNVKDSSDNVWRTPVLLIEAKNGRGMKEFKEILHKHKEYTTMPAIAANRKRQMTQFEVSYIVEALISKYVVNAMQNDSIVKMVDSVSEKQLDPYYAATHILERIIHKD